MKNVQGLKKFLERKKDTTSSDATTFLPVTH